MSEAEQPLRFIGEDSPIKNRGKRLRELYACLNLWR